MHAQATQVFADWLVSEGPRTAGVPGLIVGVAEQLNAFGFGIIRISIMLRTLHPEIESIRFGWIAEHSDIPPIGQPFFLKKRITPVGKETVEEISFSHGAFARSAPYQVSPYKKLELGAKEVHSPVKESGNEFPILDDIRLGGGTDYFLFALPNLGVVGHRVSFATKNAEGFSEEQLQLLRVAVQRFARLGGHAGAAAADQHAAEPFFERLDALAHRRGREVQRARRRLEAAFAQHGGEGGELAGIELHQFR